MTRVNGHKPFQEADTYPPRLPWVLLCHASGGRCGRTYSVNRLEDWRESINARTAHEKVCTVPPVVHVLVPAIHEF